jgi:hypothetical protein
VKKFISHCWARDPADRPSFSQILNRLKEMNFKLTANVNSLKLFEFLKKTEDWEAANVNSAASGAKRAPFPFDSSHELIDRPFSPSAIKKRASQQTKRKERKEKNKTKQNKKDTEKKKKKLKNKKPKHKTKNPKRERPRETRRQRKS